MSSGVQEFEPIAINDYDEDIQTQVASLKRKLGKEQSCQKTYKIYSFLITILFGILIITCSSNKSVSANDNDSLKETKSDPKPTAPPIIKKYKGRCLEGNYAFAHEFTDFVTNEATEGCYTMNSQFVIKNPEGKETYENNEHKKWCVNVYVSPDAKVEPVFHVEFSKLDIEPYDWLKEYSPSTHEVKIYNNGSPVPNHYHIFFEKGYISQWCLEFESDGELVKPGFEATIKIGEQKGTWNQWTECETVKIPMSAKAKWDGNCGIGSRSRSLSCPANSDHDCVSSIQHDLCPTVPCTDYYICEKEPESSACEEKSTHFSGVGRLEPEDAHVFTPAKSTKKSVTFNSLLIALKDLRTELESRHVTVDALKYGVAEYPDELLTSSRKRLGIKLARSLLMGEKFIVGTTGSSNTAGHDNMFLSSYPMQLQDILKPFWKANAVEGGYFAVRNHAIGGKLGTESQAWCVRSQVGEDVDVVYWESFMNDQGRPELSSLEVHLRNTLRLPGRPLWHALQAGTCERDIKIGEWKKPKPYDDIEKLANYYHKAGAGNIFFKPCHGLEPLRDQAPYNEAYISWHPSSKGHRMYAEVLAYEYLSATIDVLDEKMNDILDKIGHDMSKATREKVDELLKEPETEDLPEPKECGKYCKEESICLSGLRPVMPQWELQRFVRPETKWEHRIAAHGHDVSGFDRILGEQGPIDHKWAFVGHESQIDGWFRAEITIPTSGLWVHAPYDDHSTEYRDELFVESSTLRLKLDGKLYKCDSSGNIETFGKKIDGTGCWFENMPSGKHIIEVAHDEKDKVFAIHMIVTW